MAAQCGISGSTIIKNDVTFGGQSGVADNLTIEEGARIGAKSGVYRMVKKGETVWGIPARPINQTKRQMAAAAWLAKNFRAVAKLIK